MLRLIHINYAGLPQSTSLPTRYHHLQTNSSGHVFVDLSHVISQVARTLHLDACKPVPGPRRSVRQIVNVVHPSGGGSIELATVLFTIPAGGHNLSVGTMYGLMTKQNKKDVKCFAQNWRSD